MNAPAELGFRQFARLIGKKPSYITLLKDTGRLVLTENGKAVRVAESLARISDTSDPAKFAVAAHHAAKRGAGGVPTQPEASMSPPAPAQDDLAATGATAAYQDSRARREHFQAMAAERDYLISINRLLPADDVLSVVADSMAALRQRLQSLPDTLSAQLSGAATESEVRTLLADAIEHALDDAARHFSTIAKPEESKR